MARKKVGTCVYCGKVGRVTDDHIPPKNIFTGEVRIPNLQLITVPACEKCNGQAAKDDEYFRLTLALRADVYDHPQVQQLLPIIWRSLKRPESAKFAKAFGQSIGPVRLMTRSGIDLGYKPGYKPNFERLHRVAARVVKGLFFHVRGSRLPDTHSTCAYAEPASVIEDRNVLNEILRMTQIVRQGRPTTIGDSIFTYWHYTVSDEADSVMWVFEFFEKILFIGWTCPKDQMPLGLRHNHVS